MAVLCWVLFQLGSSLIWTQVFLRYARRHQLIDIPGERRSHQIATPRGGGMGIVCAVVIGLVWRQLSQAQLNIAVIWPLCGLIFVAGVGWQDDRHSCSIGWRLLVHALASALLAYGVYDKGGDVTDALFVMMITMVLINVWNFMDGINGLATTQAMIAAVAYGCLVHDASAWLAWSIAAACLGFLPFNFPRARIFLGDSGSGSLGYLMALLMVNWHLEAQRVIYFGWLPVSVFLVDASWTLAYRIGTRQRFWQPHAQHIYQRAARRYQSHAWITGVYACFSLIAISLFVMTEHLPPQWEAIGSCVWAATLTGLWWFFGIHLRDD